MSWGNNKLGGRRGRRAEWAGEKLPGGTNGGKSDLMDDLLMEMGEKKMNQAKAHFDETRGTLLEKLDTDASARALGERA